MARKPKAWQHTTASAERLSLDSHLIEGFVEAFLMDHFDGPKTTPAFHRQMWKLDTSKEPFVSIAAPRLHAKTSAGTITEALAAALFGSDDFILLIGATETLAGKLLGNITNIIQEDSALQETFKLAPLVMNETELVLRVGGRECCILAKGCAGGSGKVRGLMWRQKRPSLILLDDIEDDEAVENRDRREKLSDWMDNALIPCGSDNAKIRMKGTILHFDSYLEHTMRSDIWKSLRFAAHRSFEDFTDILWPEKFPETRLRAIRQRYIEKSKQSGYSREYLSYPMAEADAYFRRGDFVPMLDRDHESKKRYYGGVDLAISKKEKSDRCSFVIVGVDAENICHVVERRRLTGAEKDGTKIIAEWFELQRKWDIEAWMCGRDHIQMALGSFLTAEMIAQDCYMTIEELPGAVSSRDKQSVAVPFQARMRAHRIRFNVNAEWFPEYQDELLRFPRGEHDDDVDATANIFQMLSLMESAPTAEEEEDEAWEQIHRKDDNMGRSLITGY